MNHKTHIHPITAYLKAGAIAGLIAALINNIYCLVYASLAGVTIPAILSAQRITIFSVLLLIAGGMFFYVLKRFVARSNLVFTIVSLMVGMLTCIPALMSHLPNGTPLQPGFAGLSVPMHILSAGVAIILVPLFTEGRIFRS